MTRSVEQTEQLVVELFVRDVARAQAFYQRPGFTVLEDRGDFVMLAWGGHRFFLDARSDLAPPAAMPQANVRTMAPDVDTYRRLAAAVGTPVFSAIEDRGYGLRNFAILNPDGFGLRFGMRLTQSKPE